MMMEQLLKAEQRAAEWIRKDEEDSTLLVDRKSSQRIYRLIQRKDFALR